jgi:hypothetical protein
MHRAAAIVTCALFFAPMLERQPDAASAGRVQQFENNVLDREIRTLPTTGRTVVVEAWER